MVWFSDKNLSLASQVWVRFRRVDTVHEVYLELHIKIDLLHKDW